ncbi:MAG TPA: DUF4058 family protein [Pirellulales bacterium]|nr:DUF4058 family protein [Pirellulales bacterium]
MPIHDWSRVNAGTFHDFHGAWMTEIRNALNTGVLPPDYYAMAEQIAGNLQPDVLTLQHETPDPGEPLGERASATAVEMAPPEVRFIAKTEMDAYAFKRRTMVIHHASDDRIVALIEIVSRGNKASKHPLRRFVEKAGTALYRGYHLLIIDLQPPGPRDPQGIHGAVWEEISDDTYTAPPDKPLTLAAYSAGPVKTAYVQPVAVGDVLPDMPLFLEPDAYVKVPLEMTYLGAWRGVPRRWQRTLET